MRDTESEMKQRRDREVKRTVGRRMPPTFSTKVVGVTFAPGYPDNLLALAKADEVARALGGRLAVTLRRNPDNKFDDNAIEVHVPAVSDGLIGHLTRPIAARLAPELDSDAAWAAEVESVLIDPDHMERPGISINCKRGA